MAVTAPRDELSTAEIGRRYVHLFVDPRPRDELRAAIAELVAADHVAYRTSWGTIPGRLGLQDYVEISQAAFPSLSYRVDRGASRDGVFYCRWAVAGTDRVRAGGSPRPDDGRRTMAVGISGGRVTETWQPCDPWLPRRSTLDVTSTAGRTRSSRLSGANDRPENERSARAARPTKGQIEMTEETSQPDFASITDDQRETWESGDFTRIARQNVVTAEALCEAVDPHPGRRVLDVGCGSGTAALVAERRYCDVTGLDYAPELIERAEIRARANGQDVDFRVGDAQDAPFPDDSFDAVLSVYGVQFAPDQERAACELIRACESGGTIGLAGPVPDGWSGDWFAAHAEYVPPPPGIRSPLRWGTDDGLDELLGADVRAIETERRATPRPYV